MALFFSWSEKLDDVAKIRKRPGMYAGDIRDGTALHNLVLGLTTFAVARNRLHPSFNTNVILRSDSAVTVCFAGPEEWSEEAIALFSEARLKAATSIVDCIRLEPDALDIAGGVYCDLCVVNALSDWICDQTWSSTSIQTQMLRDGQFESTSMTPLFPEVIANGRSGLSTTFLPNRVILPSIVFDAKRLRNSLADLCSQNLGTRINLVDDR